MDATLFTVTIPAYKTQFLAEAIESVLTQSCQNFELVIVDDCSPYDIKSIVEHYNSDKIRYYRNEKNCGAVDVVDNWNICLSHARGRYVICMGDDDRLLPCCLEEFERLINIYPKCTVYHAWTEIIDEIGKSIRLQDCRPEFESSACMVYHQLFYNRIQYIGDFCFDSYWLKQNGGYIKFPLAYSSDWATANLAASVQGIANGQRLMFQYRECQSSISKSQNMRIAAKALLQSYRWYLDFYHLVLSKQNDDLFCRYLSDNIFEKKYETDLCNLMINDIRCNNRVQSYYYWLKNIKSFGVRPSLVLKAIILAR